MLADTATTAGDWIGQILGPLGVTVLLIYIVFAVIRGDWLPRRTHEAIVAEKDALVAAKDEEVAEIIKAKDAEIASLRGAHAGAIGLKDDIIALKEGECGRERERAEFYQNKTFRLLESGTRLVEGASKIAGPGEKAST